MIQRKKEGVEMRRLFIVNSHSGRGKGLRWGRKIEKSLERKEIEGEIVYTRETGEETILAKRAISAGYNCLISVGGDGTNNRIINGMVGSDALFGVVPAGTANDFARFFGIPQSVKGALEVITQGKELTVDLGKVSGQKNERIFLNEASFGFTARILQFFEDFRSKSGFYPSEVPIYYLRTAIKSFFQVEYFSVKLSIPQEGFKETIAEEVSSVLVANGPNCGGIFRLAPQADPTDNLLDISLIKKVSKAKILMNLLKTIEGSPIEGTHLRLTEVWTSPQGKLPQVPSLVISSPKDLPGETDGELLEAEREYNITVLPRRLRVIVKNSPLKKSTSR